MSQSHTATQEWQSFEFRMRRRRFERCVVRAAAALDAGVLEDAREALEEARALSPDDPQIAELVARLREAEAPPAPVEVFLPPSEEPVPQSGRRYLAAAAILIALSAASGWMWARGFATSTVFNGAQRTIAPSTSSQPSSPAAQMQASPTQLDAQPSAAVTPESAATSEPTALAAPGDSPSVASGTTGLARADAVRPAEAPASVAPRVDASTAVAAPPVGAGVDRPTPLPAVVENSGRTVAEAPAAPAPAPTAPESAPAAAGLESAVGTNDTSAIRVPVAPPPPAAPAPAAAAVAAPAVNVDRMVRGALSRYEGAYNALDAAAARRVWPSVDERALARAFDGLSAQRVSLGNCDVRVAGPKAQADCTGNASWTPKVGSGAQSASRRWRFELMERGGDWVIVNATVR